MHINVCMFAILGALDRAQRGTCLSQRGRNRLTRPQRAAQRELQLRLGKNSVVFITATREGAGNHRSEQLIRAVHFYFSPATANRRCFLFSLTNFIYPDRFPIPAIGTAGRSYRFLLSQDVSPFFQIIFHLFRP